MKKLSILIIGTAGLFLTMATGCGPRQEKPVDAEVKVELTPILSLADFALEYVLSTATEESYRNPEFLNNLKGLRNFDKEFYGILHKTQLADKYYLTRAGFSCCPCPPVRCCDCQKAMTFGTTQTMNASLTLRDGAMNEVAANSQDIEGARLFTVSHLSDGDYTLILKGDSIGPPIEISIMIKENSIHFN